MFAPSCKETVMDNTRSSVIRLLAILLCVVALDSEEGRASAMHDACTPEQWAIANCGFAEDCGEEFLPEYFGCGEPQICAYDPINDFVYYEGWCYPSDEPCTISFCS
jgi:hypothetical protein